MGKKRKHDSSNEQSSTTIDTSKPTAIFKATSGRKWTVSIAVPGSIMANAQSRELQTILAGHIARALAVFCVDELVIFSDGQFTPPPSQNLSAQHSASPNLDQYTGFTHPNHFLAHILSYLECPANLRRTLFPRHPNLQHAGMLPSLDMPHHLKPQEYCRWREGVTGGSEKDAGRVVTHVQTGLKQDVHIEGEVAPGSRVTVDLQTKKAPDNGNEPIAGRAVAPSTPREKKGLYWGYSVRDAASLSAVLTECPFDGGYDLSIGTSERGKPVSEISADAGTTAGFKHMMIVYGGVAGLEVAVQADEELKKVGVEKPEELFDHWVNLVPGQGSRTIRTEEAVWVGLMGLRGVVERNVK
ncbi:MAG: hypothetical protein OHK93_006269 [Ramalina farinacea]|uniref:DUF171-domain-containing protein n=1 Tax=Ramalina farinacea TaxID=258253 RepID=A0AA43TWL5_9LECA|nr:hypothetical protein [Ramalina farinacea]